MRKLAVRLLVTAAAASATMVSPASVLAEPPLANAALRARFASVISSLKPVDRLTCESHGSALYLGDDLYVTAGHVLLERSDLARACRFPPQVVVDAARTPRDDLFRIRVKHHASAIVVGEIAALGHRETGPSGQMDFAGSADYAMVRAKTALPSPALQPCAEPARPGQVVIVVLRDSLVMTRVATTQSIKPQSDARFVDLDKVFDHGTSGAGVLDAQTSCVMGLISHRWPEPTPRVTRMTPTAVFVDDWRKIIAP